MEKKEKLKILAASDTHGDSKLMEKISKKAIKENVDLIVLCGDILGFYEKKNIIEPLKKSGKPILIIPGNHETMEMTNFISELYNIKNIHANSAIYKEIAFFGAGGAEPSLDFSESELFSALEKAHNKIYSSKKKVMVTHMHPKNSKSEFSGFQGSKAILRAINKFQPDILIHGHIHEASGLEEMIGKTRVVNVARQGRIIEI